MRLTLALIAVLAALPAAAFAAPPATQPSTAAEAFVQAAAALVVDGPGANAEYDGHYYPPYPPLWHRLSKQAWEQNAPARAIARRATTLPAGTWPEPAEKADPESPYGRAVNDARSLANDLGDAMLYAQTLGRPNDALALAEDLDCQIVTLASDGQATGSLLRLMVANGIDALRCMRVLTLAPQLDFSPTAADRIDRDRVKRLINTLLLQTPGQKQWDAFAASRQRELFRDANGQIIKETQEQSRKTTEMAVRSLDRVNAERTFAAMSLACQLFKADNGRWPETADELVPGYLKTMPIDSRQNPPTPFGYSLEVGGLPDGGDRPLVYTEYDSADGLRHAMNGPFYGYYPGDGSPARPGDKPGRHGQFRDVAAWPATSEK